jgi:hypothetical protein
MGSGIVLAAAGFAALGVLSLGLVALAATVVVSQRQALVGQRQVRREPVTPSREPGGG